MTDQSDLRHLPEAIAVPRQRMRVSAVWIIPILAALVALGIAIQRVWSEGPTITILFDAAPGIEAGKTFVKYKDVKIGQVTAVQLSEEPGKVEVRAKVARSAARLMVENAADGQNRASEVGQDDNAIALVRLSDGGFDHLTAGPQQVAQTTRGNYPCLTPGDLAGELSQPSGQLDAV